MKGWRKDRKKKRTKIGGNFFNEKREEESKEGKEKELKKEKWKFNKCLGIRK